ncbi:predicted protein [Uncinocarpus reesii 1704]|uniref:Uncharacterized protein n=1 Tax=Uncinocarpus reesii (strain UAMH 1704) TaxID=336963 RepID=C4JNW9_UNCRE|nr:uncharacterized protein UREG_04439 [Uncinocarpus reesii 1704]EEP79593.1 predicted protein [Uncinocarpus reesii 1704]
MPLRGSRWWEGVLWLREDTTAVQMESEGRRNKSSSKKFTFVKASFLFKLKTFFDA